MTRLTWNEPGTRYFEGGLDQGVLYPGYAEGAPGIPWNGLISVVEDPTGGDVEPVYFEGVKIADVVSAEDFQATVTAFSAPPEFAACEGKLELAPGLLVGNQERMRFGLSYRTGIGNDLQGLEVGHKIHLVWNCVAAPASRTRKTLTAGVEPENLAWTIHTVPPRDVPYRPTAHMVIDTRWMDPEKVAVVESYLYGDDEFAPTLPHPNALVQLLSGVPPVD